MNIIEAIQNRRSVKAFDPDHVMSEAEEKQLLSLAMLSPTSLNLQHWRFVVVRDEATRAKIREASWDQTQVTDSSLLIVLCADLQAWKKAPERYWAEAPEEVREYILPTIENYYGGREGVQRDEAMRSCGIAAQTLMLAAKGMGYDSCPMGGFDPDRVADIINLPDDHVIGMFITIGKGVKSPWPRSGQLSMEEVVIYDGF